MFGKSLVFALSIFVIFSMINESEGQCKGLGGSPACANKCRNEIYTSRGRPCGGSCGGFLGQTCRCKYMCPSGNCSC